MEESSQKYAPYQLEDNIYMVPCQINTLKEKFVPITKPKLNESKVVWEEAEDQALMRIIHKKGSKKWTAIAKELNEIFHAGKPLRHGKQCRERWYNHLNPCLRKGEWTPEEDLFIIKYQQRFGNKWSLIARELPGRTENSVKNRWKSIMSKAKKHSFEMVGSVSSESGGVVGEGCGEYSESLPDLGLLLKEDTSSIANEDFQYSSDSLTSYLKLM